MIDPLVSLAFAVYSNKGAYALLLGSGISRSSGIPTGWEVVLDLVRKVAKLEGDDCEPDPAEWFRKKHGAEPDYSKLLDEIAKQPTERQQLLRGYFEPTEDDRNQGLKLPSPAHKAIAQLVASGYLRVIITTNFDRLMETALEAAGVTPTVISTTDQIAGALPLVHSGATVIKLHGDYLDTRIKNTENELATYDKPLDQLLDRIFDEYGLIVSGWSGDWDFALRAAIERCPTRRFTTFWGTRSALSGKGEKLAEHRRATVIQTKDANELFENLREKVQALGDMAAPHPLSAKMAAATLKRYLVDPSAKIRLRDMVHDVTEKLFSEISGPTFDGNARLPQSEELANRVARYGALSETLLAILTIGAYWGNADSTKLWVNALQRIASLERGGGSTYLLNLRRYPALLLLFGSGIASIAAGNYATLACILTTAKAQSDEGTAHPICSVVYPFAVMEDSTAHLLPGLDRNHTPVSDHLFGKLREPLREFLPNDEDYDDAFNRFEYLFGLIHADIVRWENQTGCWWGPVGRFGWRRKRIHSGLGVSKQVDAEIAVKGADWPLLKAGLFGGKLEQLKSAKAKFDAHLSLCNFR